MALKGSGAGIWSAGGGIGAAWQHVWHGDSGRELLLLLLAAGFVLVNSVSLALVSRWPWQMWGAPAGWLLAFGGAHVLLRRTRPRRDALILPLIALLSGWGLILIARLAENFLWRQMLWLVVALGLLLAVTLLPGLLRWLQRYRYSWLTAGLLLLLATLFFGVNPSGGGAALWLPLLLRTVYFQPSELLKLLLVIFLASYFDDRQMMLRLRHGRYGALAFVAPLLVMWGFCMLLLVWQQDLGAAALFFMVFLSLLYLATGRWSYLLSGGLLLLAATVVGYMAFAVVARRIMAWLNPWPNAADSAFQIVQSLYALASGGLFGQGVGQGFPDYIPVVHSDFAFAAIAEEWGALGALVVIALFAVLVQRGLRLAARVQRPFQRYLAAGIATLFAAQSILIMGGVTRLLPLTGVTLPFVSYGGSSLLVSCVMAGLLLRLSTLETDV